MSGGHFQYKQWEILNIADEVEQLILDNDSNDLDEWGYTKGTHFNKETIIEFKTALETLRKAYVYAQRIDWLVSGDDGEDSFHNRLKGELDALEKRNN
jgi:hypothetical protein